MERYKKIVLEVEDCMNISIEEKNFNFFIEDTSDGTLKIRGIKDKKTNLDKKSEIRGISMNITGDYRNPVIPIGYEYVNGKWLTGFVIERISDNSRFVWIPVGVLPANGTLDGIHFDQQFGRRNYNNDIFNIDYYHQEITEELKEIIKSIELYGGFWIAAFEASWTSIEKNKEIRFVKTKKSINCINFNEAKELSNNFETCSNAKSTLVYGEMYDTVLEWLKLSENDLEGSLYEWTIESYSFHLRVFRSGFYIPNSYRSICLPTNSDKSIGFRSALYIVE